MSGASLLLVPVPRSGSLVLVLARAAPVLIGVVFFAAAVLKLQSEEPFGTGTSRFAQFAAATPRGAALLVSSEFAVGLLLVGGVWWKPLRVASIAAGLFLLAAFEGFLLVSWATGSIAACGCFGSVGWLQWADSPVAAHARNLLFLGLLGLAGWASWKAGGAEAS